MPVFGAQFYTTFAFNKYLKDKIEASINDNELIGPHTDIIAMEYHKNLGKCMVKKFLWSHPGIKPFGIPLDQQCKKCKVLRNWKTRDKMANKITIRCGNCKDTKVYDRHDLLNYCQKDKEPYKKADAEWMYEVIVDPSAMQM